MSKSDATLESWEQKSLGGGKREMEREVSVTLSENASNAPRHQG